MLLIITCTKTELSHVCFRLQHQMLTLLSTKPNKCNRFTELQSYVPLDTKWRMLEIFFPGDLLVTQQSRNLLQNCRQSQYTHTRNFQSLEPIGSIWTSQQIVVKQLVQSTRVYSYTSQRWWQTSCYFTLQTVKWKNTEERKSQVCRTAEVRERVKCVIRLRLEKESSVSYGWG